VNIFEFLGVEFGAGTNRKGLRYFLEFVKVIYFTPLQVVGNRKTLEALRAKMF